MAGPQSDTYIGLQFPSSYFYNDRRGSTIKEIHACSLLSFLKYTLIQLNRKEELLFYINLQFFFIDKITIRS